MNTKGQIKRVSKPNFWRKYQNKVPEETKTFVYGQYFNSDSVFVYCDTSLNASRGVMAVACSYVLNGTIKVKQQYVYPPHDCMSKPVYGEMKAILFALANVEKHIHTQWKNLIIYTDIDHIESLLNGKSKFRKSVPLRQVRTELIDRYEQLKNKYPHHTIKIEYLHSRLKAHNPFHKSAHNGAKRMVQ